MGIITFLLTKLANKFSKKNMGGLNVWLNKGIY
jgi:hypothetical protein